MTLNTSDSLKPGTRRTDIVKKVKKSDEGGDVLARNIKANKEIIILSIISKKSICGIDLIKEIFLEAHVFLSPGTVYPILYHLETLAYFKLSMKQAI
jgi:hypothetical protein